MSHGSTAEASARLALERERYVAALDQALDELLRRLRTRPEVHRVILFGSYAAGRRDLFTDLDLLVVMDSAEPFVTRTAALYRDLAPRVDVDLLVYTPDEFERLRHGGFVRRAIETGTVLHERAGTA
jgi:predicted nucleotidyltransferase